MALIRLPWQRGEPEPVPRHRPGEPIHQLSSLLPVAPGRRAALDTALAALRAAPSPPSDADGPAARGWTSGTGGPFAALAQVHTVRFEVLDTVPVGRWRLRLARLDPAVLVFAVTFEGNLDHLARSLRDRVAEHCDAILGCCEGYPGSAAPGLDRWLRAHRLEPALLYDAGSTGRHAIERALGVRRELRDFAVAARGLPPAELRRDFLATFNPAAAPAAPAAAAPTAAGTAGTAAEPADRVSG